MSTLHLDALLNPNCIAVVGASARSGSKGLALMQNLIFGGYTGTVCPVNPRYDEVEGMNCYNSIKDCPETPDLIIVLSPERTLKKTLKQASKRSVRVAIVMSEVADSQQLHRRAKKLNIRLLGPFCAGLIRPSLRLNATYAVNQVNEGRIGLISQSASLGAAMLDWAESANVGFSAMLSTGTISDITLADLLDLLAEDHHTRAIVVYIDHIAQTRSFMSAISSAARIKPVILMKSAVDAAEYCDVYTHTGEVLSGDDVFQAAMQRAGVVRIRTFVNLYTAARMLESGMRTQGGRVAIISNGAAPAHLALERLNQRGLSAPTLPREIRLALKPKLNAHWSRGNPMVLREHEGLVEAYGYTLKAIANDAQHNFDAVVVIYVPDAITSPEAVARAVLSHRPEHLPIAVAWMGDKVVHDARALLTEQGLPTFRTPENAIDCIDFLHRYYVSQQQLLQLPNPTSRTTEVDVPAARAIIKSALAHGERILGPQKARRLLQCFNMNTQTAIRAVDEHSALSAAHNIGYPVAVKLVSPNLMHKAAVARTQLNILNDSDLVEAFNHMRQALDNRRPGAEFRGVLVEAMYQKEHSRSLALSIHQDPTFGPVITLSMGGDVTPVSAHRAMQLPPLNQFLIETMLNEQPLKAYLDAWQYQPAVDVNAIAFVLRRISEMATELPDIYSLDINPLEVSEDGAVVLGVRVVLEERKTERAYTHLAIHPYPVQWQKTIVSKNQNEFLLRPVRPTDAGYIRELVKNMSAESRYFRFMHAVNDLSPRMVVQFTKLDYDRQMAFVAIPSGMERIVGVSRYTIDSSRVEADFAIAIDDNYQGQGLASNLMRHLIKHATEQDLYRLRGDVLRSNSAMRGLMEYLGFTATTDPDDPEVLVYSLKLNENSITTT